MNERLSTIGLHPFDPAFEHQYGEGDRVEFSLDGDFTKPLLRGTIRGLASAHLTKHWIVELDTPLPDWSYSSITVQHTFMRLEGSNEPFPNTIPCT